VADPLQFHVRELVAFLNEQNVYTNFEFKVVPS
jgi:hypothetical protein